MRFAPLAGLPSRVGLKAKRYIKVDEMEKAHRHWRAAMIVILQNLLPRRRVGGGERAG